MTFRLPYLFLFLTLFLCRHTGNAQTVSISLQEVARGFTSPVGMVSPDDGTNRLFVLEQGGLVRIVSNGKVLDDPFLDVSDKLDRLNIAYSEKGLLGMAFHPQFSENGRFYIYYSAPYKHPRLDHKSIISEYTVSSTDPNKANDNEYVIMEIYQPESNHNGGMLAFGPDGYLYIGTGDGGGAGDEHGSIGNGQDLNSLLGKILRVDVNGRKPYAIPYDNPFVGKEGTRAEIWAYGLRNPWRFSFDKQTGQLFCGDVGQNEYEETNLVEKGGNYGWRIMEASHCYDPPSGCDTRGLEMPIDEYDHSEGISICGGHMYRGKLVSGLNGKYVFGDWSGKLFLLEKNPDDTWSRINPDVNGSGSHDIDAKLNSMGEDQDGEIYLLTQKLFGPKSPTGVLYMIR